MIRAGTNLVAAEVSLGLGLYPEVAASAEQVEASADGNRTASAEQVEAAADGSRTMMPADLSAGHEAHLDHVEAAVALGAHQAEKGNARAAGVRLGLDDNSFRYRSVVFKCF